MATGTTERAGTADLHGTGWPSVRSAGRGTVADAPAGYGGVGWTGGSFHDYDRVYCVDLVQLAAFLRDTQPAAADALTLSEDGPTRRAFLTRLQGEIAKHGTIDVLRNGVRHRALHLDLFYGTPSEHNAEAQERFAQNPLHGYPAASLQPGRGRGSCRSIAAGTTVRATRRTRTGWRSTTCGGRCCRGRA